MKCYKCGRLLSLISGYVFFYLRVQRLFTSLRQGWTRMRAELSKSARGDEECARCESRQCLTVKAARTFIKICCFCHLSLVRPLVTIRDSKQYSNEASGWMIRGSNPGRGKRFFFPPEHPYRLWTQPSSLFKGYRELWSGVKRPAREAHCSMCCRG
jgi:hypothetical protein